MGIIAKLKDVLGIADRQRSRRADSTDVAVERETDATSERAVKGVESSGDAGAAQAGGSGGVTTDEEPADDTVDVGEDATADDGEPVDAIKGIGASYADRLGEAGILTVEDLADADAEDVAEQTGIGAGRIGNWIERAQVRSR